VRAAALAGAAGLACLSIGAAPVPPASIVSAPVAGAINDALILGDTLPPRLSEFGLLAERFGLKPARGVMPYSLATPLFSDYAEKYRFAYVPSGARIVYSADGVLAFPVGSVLIKSFGYPADFRRPTENLRIIETRLLIHRASGWVALPYVWNEDGTEAMLKRAGMRIDIGWTHSDGSQRQISYAVPNVNQCKGCHSVDGQLTPIGPKARNLDSAFLSRASIAGLPAQIDTMPRWNDPAAGSVESRARAYLDVNCAHCHNPRGPASNSGLFLDWGRSDKVALGIGKRPVAAGGGAGQLSFDIAAGHPERSIMLYRLASIEPGIAMPELGRATAHAEGLALLSEWISAMPAGDEQ
jgi:uncharacterized repeat protein (TIGR03806 family)